MNDGELHACFQNIRTRLAMSEEGEIAPEKKALIDKLYQAGDGKSIATILEKTKILPNLSKYNKRTQDKILDVCTALRGQLKDQEKMFNSLPAKADEAYIAQMKKHNEARKSELISK